jgi:hypothetical protein
VRWSGATARAPSRLLRRRCPSAREARPRPVPRP